MLAPVDPTARLIASLLEVATKPENVFRHDWRTGDLVLWDNRATLHKGPNPDELPPGAVRDLVRVHVTPKGEKRPYGPPGSLLGYLPAPRRSLPAGLPADYIDVVPTKTSRL